MPFHVYVFAENFCRILFVFGKISAVRPLFCAFIAGSSIRLREK